MRSSARNTPFLFLLLVVASPSACDDQIGQLPIGDRSTQDDADAGRDRNRSARGNSVRAEPDAGVAATGPCSDGVTRCRPDGVTLQSCNGGAWETEACEFACSGGTCTGECAPGQTRCQGSTLEGCTAEGNWIVAADCSQGCEDAACSGCPSAPSDCPGPGTACRDDELISCGFNSEGCVTTLTIEACPSGTTCGGAFPAAACQADAVEPGPQNGTGGGPSETGCTAGASRCSADASAVERCIDGIWEPFTCDFGCSENACNGPCVAGERQCGDVVTVVVCSEDGEWGYAASCENGCVEGECSDCPLPPSQCAGAGLACRGSDLLTCSVDAAGCLVSSAEPCANGASCTGAFPTALCAEPAVPARVVGINAGRLHTCAVLDDGTLRCWGYNGSGRLGNGSTTTSFTPVVVSGIDNAVEVVADDSSTCALLDDGSIRCWGYNYSAQLGDGTTTDRTTPVAVSGISAATGLALGSEHACAVLDDGSVWCWGYRGYWGNRFGDGIRELDIDVELVPVPVSNLSGVAALYKYFHSCMLPGDGTASCWGTNGRGKLGNGSNEDSPTPVQVSGLFNIVTLAMGGNHVCALLEDASVACWGNNQEGELGNGNTDDSFVAVPVASLPPALSVAAGAEHTCALATDGSVRCWGNNVEGAVGVDDFAEHTTPTVVEGVSGAVALTAGGGHTCVLIDDGRVLCWGDNLDGQLGDGSDTTRRAPVAVVGL